MSNLAYLMFRQSACAEDHMAEILQTLKEQKKFFMIASPETSPEDFEKKKFAMYVTENKVLPVFLDMNSAGRKAKEAGAVTDNQPMTIASTDSALNTLLEKYNKGQLISAVRFFSSLPFYMDVPVSSWLDGEEAVTPEPNESIPAAESAPSCPEMVGVKGLIKMLDCQDRSKIAEKPTYKIFESFPELLRKLIQANKIVPAELDEALQLPSGVTERTISSPQANVSKDVLKSYLGYFGLGAYLYRYAAYSDELQSDLNKSKNICTFEIKPAKINTKERFTLETVARAKDVNDAWLYRLTFKSKARPYQCIVTSPLGMIEGKDYELTGLPPMGDESGEKTFSAPAPVIDKEIGDEVIQKAREKFEKEQRGYLDIRKDYVIRYFKNRNPDGRSLQFKEAEKHYNKMTSDDDILDEFFWKCCCPKDVAEKLETNEEYLRRKSKQPKDIRVRDYTAEKLRKEFKLNAGFEQYFALIDLRRAPRKTMERLKYRKTDPQYQRDKKE